jgi:hypothetical protein
MQFKVRAVAVLALLPILLGSCSSKKPQSCDQCQDLKDCPKCPIGLVNGNPKIRYARVYNHFAAKINPQSLYYESGVGVASGLTLILQQVQ